MQMDSSRHTELAGKAENVVRQSKLGTGSQELHTALTVPCITISQGLSFHTPDKGAESLAPSSREVL